MEYAYPDTLKFTQSDMSRARGALDFDQKFRVASSYDMTGYPLGDGVEAFGKLAQALNGYVRATENRLEVIFTRPMDERDAAARLALMTSPEYADLRDKRAAEQGLTMQKVTLVGVALPNED